MANAERDQNNVTTLIGVSSSDGVTPTLVYVNPATGRMLVDLPGGSGTVSSVSVVSANGFAGTVATATTTPAITLSTTITGILSGNGTAISAASTTGSGSVVLATAPTITGGTLTTTSVNGVTLTTGGGTTTFLNANGAYSTPGATAPGGLNTQVQYNNSGAFAGITGATTNGTIMSLTNPLIGGSTITTSTFNGNTLTTGSSTYTGTAAATYTFPTSTATIARTDAAQTFTGTQTFSQQVTTVNAITATANAATVPITSRISNVTNNSAATLTITMTTASAVDGMQVMVRIFDFSAVAETLTFINTENSTVSVPTTSNGSTTLPLTVGFQFNGATSKWRCIAIS